MELIHSMASSALLTCCILVFFVSLATASNGHADTSPETRVARSAGASAVGMFAETEDGQVEVITDHGAITDQHELGLEREEEKKIEPYAPEDWAIIRKELLESGAGDEEDMTLPLLARRSLDRDRRFMTLNKQWPKAIVPYDFNTASINQYYQDEALAAMTKWHKYTCIRFVPWVEQETMHEYGLTEESHVTITKGSGCAAHQGNIRRKNGGQYNSCCGRYTCIHELGHTLGLWHEHQSPQSADVMELNKNKVPANKLWTYRMREPGGKMMFQYDTANTMHYGGSAFRILYEDLASVIKMSNQFYMYKDVSLYHQCQEDFCSDFTMHCHNDGFVTLVDDQCSCLCPPGLDPTTGCTTTIKHISTSSEWPAGAYAMLSPINGCPGNSEFSMGSWQHTGEGGNSKSDDFHLAGSFDGDTFRYEFCVKDGNSDSSTVPEWEPGRYCILRVNGDCPAGFKSGFIQFDDAADSTGQPNGVLPDGVSANDTRFEFCCRDDGFTSTPLLNVPNTQPLVLFSSQADKGGCQEIAGMRWIKEFMVFQSFRDSAQMNGSHAYVSKNTFFKTWFCYYVPANLNCGGEVTLTRANRKVEITSPNYPAHYEPNLECTWLIKADEAGGRVIVNFDDMKVTSSHSSCQDSLEIRYNLPGQPGLRFCGDGLGRTVRSLNDTVLITLRSDIREAAEDRGFNLTASLFLPDEDECFDPSTRGSLYRGQKNYTRSMRPCLDWNLVTECPHHAFKSLDFGAGLDKNYCRNPDNTAMPWCYTSLGCQRDYCDVCNNEREYNRAPSCSPAYCQRASRDQAIADGCAETCNVLPPQAPDRACSDGWAYFRGACYKWFDDFLSFDDARKTCGQNGAMVSSQKDEEEQDFTSSLRAKLWVMWSGATDEVEEGRFVWEDGTLVTWTNWENENTPNNYRNQDCVQISPDNYNRWNDVHCTAHRTFVCKYELSDRQICADRHPDCQSVLMEVGDACTAHPDFADQLCPYACGLCDAHSTPACDVTPSSSDVLLLSPTNANVVSRGASVHYACQEGYVLTEGKLILACGDDGDLIGQLPVCKHLDDTIQEINAGAELVDRRHLQWSRYAYTSMSDNLAIERHGVIKQWRYFSRRPGWSFFQVWRPDPAGGDFMFVLVGQNQIMTSGEGPEMREVPEEDWIHVQPGDKIALFEPYSPRGGIPYDGCNPTDHPDHAGGIRVESRRSYGDYSATAAESFSTRFYCRMFSFRAVVCPLDSVPNHPKLVTSQVPLLSRSTLGAPNYVYLADSNISYVPADGVISQWQFYVKRSGQAALQVWRRRSDQGVQQYEFIGQNEVSVTMDTPHVHTMSVPEGERLAVQAGDIIGLRYGPTSATRLGIPYTRCSAVTVPESDNVYWLKTSEPLTENQVYSFRYSSSSMCRIFSFRAVVNPVV